jgi:hypothetical protein
MLGKDAVLFKYVSIPWVNLLCETHGYGGLSVFANLKSCVFSYSGDHQSG